MTHSGHTEINDLRTVLSLTHIYILLHTVPVTLAAEEKGLFFFIRASLRGGVFIH